MLAEIFINVLKLLVKASAGVDSLSNTIITEGLMIAKKLDSNILELKFRYYQGYLLFERNQVYKSIVEHEQILKFTEKGNSINYELRALNLLRLAIGYRRIGKFQESREDLIRALKFAVKANLKGFYLKFRSNYAATFYYIDPKKHHQYYQRSLEIAQRQDDLHREGRLLLQIATNYFRFGNYELAKKRFASAQNILHKIQSPSEEIRYNLNYSCFLIAYQHEYNHAELLLKEAEAIAVTQKNFRRLWRIYSNLATIFEQKKDDLTYTYDHKVWELLVESNYEGKIFYENVIEFNREQCAILNIMLRGHGIKKYQLLIENIKKQLSKSLFNSFKKECTKINNNVISDIRLNLSGFCKPLNTGYRFLIPE